MQIPSSTVTYNRPNLMEGLPRETCRKQKILQKKDEKLRKSVTGCKQRIAERMSTIWEKLARAETTIIKERC